MPFTNEALRIYYTARNRQSGLSDVRMYVYKPNGVRLGPYSMVELNAGIGAGVYYDDFLDADMEGNYLFVVDSVSNPHRDEKSFFFENKVFTLADRSQILSDLTFLRDIEGGSWRIIGTQMVFYKSDNTTEVARFNLFNEAGLPSNQNVFRRNRV